MSPAPPELAQAGSQFVIATHSPILMADPGATIYELSSPGIGPVDFEEPEHVQVTRGCLVDRAEYSRHLLGDA